MPVRRLVSNLPAVFSVSTAEFLFLLKSVQMVVTVMFQHGSKI